MNKMQLELLEIIRNSCPEKIAEQILSVQPMDPKTFTDLYQILKDNPDHRIVITPQIRSDERKES